jgi:hypothetical protein
MRNTLLLKKPPDTLRLLKGSRNQALQVLMSLLMTLEEAEDKAEVEAEAQGVGAEVEAVVEVEAHVAGVKVEVKVKTSTYLILRLDRINVLGA